MIQTVTQSAENALGALSFDEDGFALDTDTWTRESARMIAEMDGIGDLTDQHWVVINFLRERFFAVGGVPAMRTVCKACGLQQDEIQALFGSCCAVWRLAGLPNPGEEARAYMACMS